MARFYCAAASTAQSRAQRSACAPTAETAEQPIYRGALQLGA